MCECLPEQSYKDLLKRGECDWLIGQGLAQKADQFYDGFFDYFSFFIRKRFNMIRNGTHFEA